MNAETVRRILDTATCTELIRLREMAVAELARRCEACKRDGCLARPTAKAETGAVEPKQPAP